MNIVTKIGDWQKIRAQLQGKSIGFLPTMGHLHQGHLSLCQRAKAQNDLAVVSIFVNPTQFNQTQDFDSYPRSLQHDQELLEKAGVEYLFLPDAEEIYADGFEIQVSETNISKVLEGEFRPGHFTGMLTVVLKLLNIISPTRAYFGEKDYQQLLLIKKMAQALFLPVEIIACETIRAKDELALSSRNSRLTAAQRQKATQFAQALQSNLNTQEIKNVLETQGFKVDYVADQWGRRLAAVWIDEVRLIDNREIPLC